MSGSCACPLPNPRPSPAIDQILSEFRPEPDSLIPILHAAQKRTGYLRPEAIERIAAFLSLPASRVFGVATFYSLLATTPQGKYIIRVCGSAPCYVVGSANILNALSDQLGIEPGETTADGRFTLESTSCLGVCGVAPAMMIGDQVYGNLTLPKITEILNEYRLREM